MRKSVFFASLFVFIIGYLLFVLDFYGLIYRPMPVPAGHSVIIHFDKNASASTFVRILKLEHLIRSHRLFLMLIRLQGLSNKLKAGIYEIKPGETAQAFLMRVVHGDVLVLSFRIIEGSNLNNLKRDIKNACYLIQDDTALAQIAGAYPSAEGLFLADTYRYAAGSNEKALLMNANQMLQQVLQKAWETRERDLPYQSSYDMLIAASILEKETALPKEKRLISGVIVNRLRKHMPLQMDPTVIYALGEHYHDTLKHQDLNVDSPYNTYLHQGLPPTPIAMVSKDAIEAAAHPIPSKYLYFVARGDGSHQFSETYEEQRNAIINYMHHKAIN